MHPYTQRIVRAWYRRFSRFGWTIYVIDRHLGSSMNVENFLDVNDRSNFPQAFAEGTITGTCAVQHTSDLVRWPLLLKYGGVYTDVGLMQIGDLDALWNQTVGDPARNIVEQCLKRSFGFKLAHGLILRVHRETLGSMWRKHTGSDAVVGTYAHWLRYGMVHWCQVELPEKIEYAIIEPLKTGPLLKGA